jgi:hypothetical protein
MTTAHLFKQLRSVQAVRGARQSRLLTRLIPIPFPLDWQLGQSCASILESIVEAAPPHPGPGSADSGQPSLGGADDIAQQAGLFLDVDRYW